MRANAVNFAVHADRRVGVDRPGTQSGQHRWWAFIALHVASAFVMVAVIATVPDRSGTVALVFWPTSTATEAFVNAAAAGGRPIRFGTIPWIVIAAPEPNDRDFFARARAAGALLIVNPLIVGGCF